MASVSPSSSVSRVAGEVRVGLEFPQAPSFMLADVSALADEGARVRVVEAYYLALAKYYEAVAVTATEGNSASDSVVDSSAVVLSVASSVRSRRRRRRRALDRAVRAGEVSDDFRSVPGLSYLELVLPAHRSDIRAELGMSPSLGSLFGCPADWFDVPEALRCRVGAHRVQFVYSEAGHTAAEVLMHLAARYRTPVGTFGAVLGRKLCGVVVGRDHVVDEVLDESDQVLFPCERGTGVLTGYCYALLFKDCHVESGKQLLGPRPSLGSLLQLPVDMFRLDRLAIGVDLKGGQALHMCDDGKYPFNRVASSAIRDCKIYLDGHSLGSYVMTVKPEIGPLGVSVDWTVGALSREVVALLEKLSELSGLSVDRFDPADSELAVKTAALLDSAGRNRLRVLEAVGDNALSMEVVQECAARQGTVQDYQNARSLLTSNVSQAALFVSSGLVQHVQFVAGVPRDGKVGSGCFEVMVALVYGAGSMDSVHKFCKNVGYFAAYGPWSGG